MVTTQGAPASADGLRWVALPFKKVAEDNTAPTARFDPAGSARQICGLRASVAAVLAWCAILSVRAEANRAVPYLKSERLAAGSACVCNRL